MMNVDGKRRRMREIAPMEYPQENYHAAALVLERMHFNRRFLTRQQYADIRRQAISGDVDGASKRLGELMAVKYG